MIRTDAKRCLCGMPRVIGADDGKLFCPQCKQMFLDSAEWHSGRSVPVGLRVR